MSAPRQGDIYRMDQLGGIKAKEGHDLAVLFLGACALGQEPNVPRYLEQLGFRRSHVFEVTLVYKLEDIEHVFIADSPREAAAAACRFARGVAANPVEDLLALVLRLHRLGPVGEDGKPYNGRGRIFCAWQATPETPFEEFERQCSTTSSAAT